MIVVSDTTPLSDLSGLRPDRNGSSFRRAVLRVDTAAVTIASMIDQGTIAAGLSSASEAPEVSAKSIAADVGSRWQFLVESGIAWRSQ
jgi:hypothetical protein